MEILKHDSWNVSRGVRRKRVYLLIVMVIYIGKIYQEMGRISGLLAENHTGIPGGIRVA